MVKLEVVFQRKKMKLEVKNKGDKGKIRKSQYKLMEELTWRVKTCPTIL